MSNHDLVQQIRTEVNRLYLGEISFRAFRAWFVHADQRAYHGALSGHADPRAMEMVDEIQSVLSDLDDGFIGGDDVEVALRDVLARSDARVSAVLGTSK